MGYIIYAKKRKFSPELKDHPYKAINVKEPVYEEFKQLAEENAEEYTRLLAELIKAYKKQQQALSATGQYHPV